MKQSPRLEGQFNRQFIPRHETEKPAPIDLSPLNNKLEQLQKEQSDTNLDEITWWMRKLNNEDFTKIVDEVRTRLKRELSDEGNFKDFDLGKELIEVGKRKIESGALDNIYDPRIGGSYYPDHKAIVFPRYMDRLSPRSIILGLINIQTGNGLESLHHEVIHHIQFSEGGYINSTTKSLKDVGQGAILAAVFGGGTYLAGLNIPLISIFGIAGGYVAGKQFIQKGTKDRILITETHAGYGALRYRKPGGSPGEASNPATYQSKLRSDGNLYNNVGKISDFNNKVDSALLDIEALYAMGISDETVARLGFNDNWDPKKGHYDNLHTAVESLRTSCGLTPEELQKFIKADRLKCKIFVAEARKITIDTLKKFAEATNA
jgi:hypothetical protein